MASLSALLAKAALSSGRNAGRAILKPCDGGGCVCELETGVCCACEAFTEFGVLLITTRGTGFGSGGDDEDGLMVEDDVSGSRASSREAFGCLDFRGVGGS